MGVCVSEEGSNYVHMFVCDTDYVGTRMYLTLFSSSYRHRSLL